MEILVPLMFVFVFGLGAFTCTREIQNNSWEIPIKQCENNGGLKYYTTDSVFKDANILCENGATFNLDRILENEKKKNKKEGR